MGKKVLKVESISKVYSRPGASGMEEAYALRNVSFEMERGEVLGLVGRNGAGKSTLLKILSEIVSPSIGRILYKGVYSAILDIGSGFHPDLSGRENIFVKGELLGLKKSEIRDRFDEIVAFSGLENVLDQQVKQYSSGMFLRLAFSVAFHSRVDLLYLDEVISVGDSEFQIKAHRRVEEMIKNGTSIVLVSHNINQITDICTRALILESGRISYSGSPIKVVEEYLAGVLFGMRNPEQKFTSEEFDLKGYQVRAAGKSEQEDIYTSDPIEISIEIEKRTSDCTLEPVISITDINRAILITDSNALRLNYQKDISEKGVYNVVATVPGNVLNKGIFRVHLTFAKNGIEVIETIRDFSAFQVKPSPEGHDHPISRRLNSLLRLKLDWCIQRRS